MPSTNSGNLFSFLSAAVQRPERPFILPLGRDAISFTEAFDQAARLVHVLSVHGVKPGPISLPLNPAYTVSELGYLLADSEPRLLVVSPAKTDVVKSVFSGDI